MRTHIGQMSGVLVVLLGGVMAGCTGGQTVKSYPVQTGGNYARGKQTIVEYRCGACHTIPGIPNASGVFAPPLTYFSRRSIIAGQLPNSTRNLVQWIVSPRSVKSKTDMPVLGVTEQQARDIATYLDTLK